MGIVIRFSFNNGDGTNRKQCCPASSEWSDYKEGVVVLQRDGVTRTN